MDDRNIVALFFDRNEDAVAETQKKYASYCYSIAYGVLKNREDAEECVNDTYLVAWNSIPPQAPRNLSAFLGKITRNLSLKRVRSQTAQKRGGGAVLLTLEELSECIPDHQTPQRELQQKELANLLDAFLRTLDEEERNIFLRRYWYFDSISDIAKRFGYGESKIKTLLHRTRKKLYKKLKQEELL
ncbi:MAG: RNA polymerase sigma factor [Clostridia bacterium]|nr:RNA polymerase sigma factor [Clostridia bacterium]